MAVGWEWEGDHGWVAYGASVAAVLEAAHRRRLPEVDVDDERFVDFRNWLQRRKDDPSRRRPVRRVPPRLLAGKSVALVAAHRSRRELADALELLGATLLPGTAPPSARAQPPALIVATSSYWRSVAPWQRYAHKHSLPVVSAAWLLDSLHEAALLDYSSYALAVDTGASASASSSRRGSEDAGSSSSGDEEDVNDRDYVAKPGDDEDDEEVDAEEEEELEDADGDGASDEDESDSGTAARHRAKRARNAPISKPATTKAQPKSRASSSAAAAAKKSAAPKKPAQPRAAAKRTVAAAAASSSASTASVLVAAPKPVVSVAAAAVAMDLEESVPATPKLDVGASSALSAAGSASDSLASGGGGRRFPGWLASAPVPLDPLAAGPDDLSLSLTDADMGLLGNLGDLPILSRRAKAAEISRAPAADANPFKVPADSVPSEVSSAPSASLASSSIASQLTAPRPAAPAPAQPAPIPAAAMPPARPVAPAPAPAAAAAAAPKPLVVTQNDVVRVDIMMDCATVLATVAPSAAELVVPPETARRLSTLMSSTSSTRSDASAAQVVFRLSAGARKMVEIFPDGDQSRPLYAALAVESATGPRSARGVLSWLEECHTITEVELSFDDASRSFCVEETRQLYSRSRPAIYSIKMKFQYNGVRGTWSAALGGSGTCELGDLRAAADAPVTVPPPLPQPVRDFTVRIRLTARAAELDDVTVEQVNIE